MTVHNFAKPKRRFETIELLPVGDLRCRNVEVTFENGRTRQIFKGRLDSGQRIMAHAHPGVHSAPLGITSRRTNSHATTQA